MLIHEFPGYLSSQGITETERDLFYIVMGNYTTAPVFSGQQGSYSLWELDLRRFLAPYKNADERVHAAKILDVPEAINLDAVVTVDREAGLLIADDTTTGILYLIDVKQRSYRQILQDPLFDRKSVSTAGLDSIGIDGLEIHDGSLYFTNFAGGFFGKVPLDLASGTPTGPPSVVYNASTILDGIAFDAAGNTYITQSLDGVLFLDNAFQPPRPSLVANLPGCNSCLFGRKPRNKGFLYLTFFDMANNSSGLAMIDTK